MFKRFLSVVGCALALVSCSTKPVQLSENEIVQYRAPAAVIDEMESKFDALMKNASAKTKTRLDIVGRLLTINYRIEGEVVRYETELDTAIRRRKGDPAYSFTPQASATYSRLMQLRYLSDKEVQSVTHVYSRLFWTTRDIALPSNLRNRAAAVISGINQALRVLKPADRLQTVELFENLREVVRRHTGAAVANKSDRLPASLDQSWSEVEKAFAKYSADDVSALNAKYKKETATKAEKALASKDIELEPMQNPIPQSDRSPSSERYAPGTGTYGNIIGLSLPLGLFSLTYDDGPNSTSTIQLLDLLSSTGTPATLFWQTQNIVKNPASVEKAKALKFPINSHSWSHANLVKLDSAGLDKEINQAVSVAQDKVGVQPFSGKKTFRFFRCPYGACYSPASPVIRARLANLGLIHAYWTVDSLDWKYVKDPDRTFDLVTKGMQASGRGVVLFHDIHQSSVGVSKRLIPWIKAQKYRLATLENAVDEYNKGVKP